jgi:hypothetical protein
MRCEAKCGNLAVALWGSIHVELPRTKGEPTERRGMAAEKHRRLFLDR